MIGDKLIIQEHHTARAAEICDLWRIASAMATISPSP